MYLLKNVLPLLTGLLLAAAVAGSFSFRNETQITEPWTPEQLMTPETLQQRLTGNPAAAPLVLSIGPGAVIKGSKDIGAAHIDSNMTKLKQRLAGLPRDRELVIYCGCCPFVHCPNIRPAFQVLNDMKFTHAHLLNIEHNIKTDWISKGYAVNP